MNWAGGGSDAVRGSDGVAVREIVGGVAVGGANFADESFDPGDFFPVGRDGDLLEGVSGVKRIDNGIEGRANGFFCRRVRLAGWFRDWLFLGEQMVGAANGKV